MNGFVAQKETELQGCVTAKVLPLELVMDYNAKVWCIRS